MRISILDCNSYGFGKRIAVSDVIGCGPRTIAGIFEKYDIKTKIFTPDNLNHKYISKSDLIVFSGMISDFKIIRKLSKKYKNKKQICGGMISLNYSTILSKTHVDCVVIGEGELTTIDLIENDFNYRNIEYGVAYKDSGKIIVRKQRRLMKECELEKYTKPSTERIKDYKYFYARRVYVEVLRGCSNTMNMFGKMGCGFCCVPNIFGYPRNRSKESIVNEVLGLLKQGVKRIVLSAPDILDYYRDNPCINPNNPEPNTKELYSLFKDLVKLCKKYDAYLRIENIKPSLVNQRVVDVLSVLPKPIISGIGVESGYNKDLRLMNKPYNINTIEKAITLLNKGNVRLNIYIIYGLPFQTRLSYKTTLYFLKKLFKKVNNIEKITISKFIPIPSSAFENLKTNENMSIELNNLIKFVKHKNLQLNKRNYLNKIIEVFPIESTGKYMLCYPKKEGPYVLTPKINKKIIKVKIVNTMDRILYGKIITKTN